MLAQMAVKLADVLIILTSARQTRKSHALSLASMRVTRASEKSPSPQTVTCSQKQTMRDEHSVDNRFDHAFSADDEVTRHGRIYLGQPRPSCLEAVASTGKSQSPLR